MRDGMDRQEYLNKILEQIDNKTLREEIEKEMSAHIDDREQYYRDCGYDSETAASKAVERMGSPEAAADGFSKVHKGKRIITAILAVLSLPLSFLFFHVFWLFTVIIFAENQIMGVGISEALSLLFIIGISVVGKRYNSRFVCLVAVVDFLLMHGTYILFNLLNIVEQDISFLCSHIVFKLVALLTLDFEALNTFWRVDGIAVAPYLTFLSVAFYLAIFVLLILVFVSVCILKRPTYSLKKKHFTKNVFKVQKGMRLFIAATMLIFPVFAPSGKDKGMTVKTPKSADTLVIAQSDTPCRLSEIPPEDILIIDLDFAHGVRICNYNDDLQRENHLKNIAVSCTADPGPFSHIDGDYITQKCGNKFKYSVLKTNIPLSITKDCVYLEFLDFYPDDITGGDGIWDENAYKFVSDDSENWYKSDPIDKITAAIDECKQVEIIVEKAP